MITDRKEPERSKNEPNDVRDSTYNDIRHQIQQLTMAQDIQMPMIVMSTYQLKWVTVMFTKKTVKVTRNF